MPAPEPVIRLRSVLKSRRNSWLLALLLGAITLLCAITLLALSGWFISAAALAGLAGTAAYGFDYFRPAAIIRLCAIGRTAGRYAERLTSHYAALGLLKDLRVKAFNVLARSRPGNRHSADSLQRLVADIDLLDQLPLKVIAPWLWALSLSTLLLLFWYLLAPALLYAAGLPLLLALCAPVLTFRRAAALAAEETSIAALRRTLLLESLTMQPALLLWQRWSHKTHQFSTQDQHCLQLQLQQQQLSSRCALLQQTLLALSLLLLLWQGAQLLAVQALTVPLLLAATLALWALYEVMLPLCQSFVALGMSMAARNRLNQLADNTVPLKSGKPEPQGVLTLTAMQLSARQNGALYGPDNISVTLHSGEVLLISGASGCGKTTLLQALANQLPVTGTLQLNGQPYSEWQLCQTLGYLSQHADMFDLTLAQNLRLADPYASDAQLWQVLEDTALKDWAQNQPQQLDTVLGEYGAAVSGGQARRIALARLLLARRQILLLDEPFAGLDPDTTQQVLQALLKYQRNGILIIVSHQRLNVPQAQQLQLS